LTPRAGREAIDGWSRDDAGRRFLKVRAAAPPVDGQANAALLRLIARSLKVPPRAVSITSGEGARLKQLEIEGVDEAEVERAFGPPA
jgi:uncharacterized protein (TIGR00251 family)